MAKVDKKWAAEARVALNLPDWMNCLAVGEEFHPLIDSAFSPPSNVYMFEDIAPSGATVVPLWDEDDQSYCHWTSPNTSRAEFIRFHLEDAGKYEVLGTTPAGVAGWILAKAWESFPEPEERAKLEELAAKLEFPNWREFIDRYVRACIEEERLLDEDSADEDVSKRPIALFWAEFVETH